MSTVTRLRPVQRPSGWVNQKAPYDDKRHAHTTQSVACRASIATCCGVTAAGRAAATSRELLTLCGLDRVLDAAGLATILGRGGRGMAELREHWHPPIGIGGPRIG